MSEVLSPASEGRQSPLGDAYLMLACVLFFQLDGLAHIVTAIGRSYEAVPAGLVSQVAFGDRMGALSSLVIRASAGLLEAGIGLAAPVVVTLLLVDLGLGAVARFSPQFPVYFAAMPLKALLGVGVVLLGFGALESGLTGGLRGMLATVEQAVLIWK